MPHQFKRNIGITINSRTLALNSKAFKHLFHICHIKITTNTEVFSAPVVPTKEGMHIFYTTLSCCRVTKMAHVQLASKRQFIIGISINVLLFHHLLNLMMSRTEYFCDSIRTFCALTEHIFMSRLCMQFYRSNSRSFLSTVMFLLHHQIEFV